MMSWIDMFSEDETKPMNNTDELATLHADLEAVAVELLTHSTIAAQTGWRCNLCHGGGPDKQHIRHKEGCTLARPGVQAVLEKRKEEEKDE